MSRTTWRLFALLLIATFVLRGIALACIIPPLEMWDEYQHVGYIQYLIDNHRLPIYGPAKVPRALVQQLVRFPAGPSAIRQLGASGAVGYPPFWARFPDRPTFKSAAPDVQLYEAQHAPLYYFLAIPLLKAAGGLQHVEQSVAVLRLVNLALATAALALLLTWLGRVCRDRREAMLIALWPALQPLLLLNAVRVSNDALAMLVGISAVIALLTLISMRSAPARRVVTCAGAIGVLLGLGVLTKATDFSLLPFAGICLIVLALRNRNNLWPVLLAATVMASAFLAVAGWYYAFNLRHYHLLIPVQQATANRKNHIGWPQYIQWVRNHPWRLWPGLWYRWIITDGLWFGGWSFLHPWRMLTRVYAAGLALAAAGWLLAWLFRRERIAAANSESVFTEPAFVPLAIVLSVIVFAGLSVHALEALVAWGGDGTWPWYAAVATPWMLIAIAGGAVGWRRSRLGYGVGLVVPLAFIAAEWTGAGWQMIRLYSQLLLGMPAVGRVAMLQPHWLGTSTLLSCAAGAAILTIIALLWCTATLWDSYRQLREKTLHSDGRALVIANRPPADPDTVSLR